MTERCQQRRRELRLPRTCSNLKSPKRFAPFLKQNKLSSHQLRNASDISAITSGIEQLQVYITIVHTKRLWVVIQTWKFRKCLMFNSRENFLLSSPKVARRSELDTKVSHINRLNSDDLPTPKSPTRITFWAGIFTEAIAVLWNWYFFSAVFLLFIRGGPAIGTGECGKGRESWVS